MRLSLLGRWIGIAGAGAIALALTGVAAWTLALSWRPTDKYVFQGVDVSEDQGAVEWWTVKGGGANFAYMRATSGAAGRDQRFEKNWAEVEKTGMRRGAMHRYSLCNLAVDQANNFNTTVPKDEDALPAAVELDFTDDCAARPEQTVVVDELRKFLTMVEAHTGKPVLLRIASRFDGQYKVTQGIPRPVWAIGNFFPPEYAARPWRMWQASDMRRIDGVDGPVHWDVVRP